MDISIGYVSIENQPEEIQEVFRNYFEGSLGLYEDNTGTIKHGYITKDRVKLLTEGQIRKFIEDKTKCKVAFNIGELGYQFILYNFKKSNEEEENICDYYKTYELFPETDLLQAYWKVALKIAKEVLE